MGIQTGYQVGSSPQQSFVSNVAMFPDPGNHFAAIMTDRNNKNITKT